MVYIFGVNFGTENNVQGALSSNSSLLFPQRQSMMTNNNNPNCWNTNIIGSRDDASSSLPNNHYGLEYLAEDFKVFQVFIFINCLLSTCLKIYINVTSSIIHCIYYFIY
jgi:hypothetical protein